MTGGLDLRLLALQVRAPTKESELLLQAEGKAMNSPLEPPERKAALLTPWS